MNEDQTTLNPVGDEIMEARIIAWVLGQASAFEAGELEKICAQQPEWHIFRRRMVALHGLFEQTAKPSEEGQWKLSESRRAALDAVLGKHQLEEAPQPKKTSNGKLWIKRSAAMAALLMVLFAVASLSMGSLMPKQRESVAVVEFLESREKMHRREQPPMSSVAPPRGASAPMPAAAAGNVENAVQPVDGFADGSWFERQLSDQPEVVAKHKGAAIDAPSDESAPAPQAWAVQEDEGDKAEGARFTKPEVLAKRQDSDGSLMVIPKALQQLSQSPGEPIARAESDAIGSVTMATGETQADAKFAPLNKPQAGKSVAGLAGEKNFPTEYQPPSADGNKDTTVDEVRRKLYLAEGQLNLGKFDDAKKDYEDVLRIDPYNEAARRSLERIAGAQSDYYRSAYDHTRAEMLMDVDKAWDLAVPDQASESKLAENAMDDVMKNVSSAWGYTSAAEGKDHIVWSDPDQIPEIMTKGKRSGSHAITSSSIDELLKKTNDGAMNLENKTRAKTRPKLLAPTPSKKTNTIADEISTATEPYSTFSLRVSDASFKLAQAALARGERPAPESVRIEEFYNAFDYGDPVPSAKEPVSCFMEQAAHPLFASRNLLRVSMRTAAAGRSAGQPLHLTLLVDQSGSMVRADRADVMRAAISELTSLLGPQDQVSIIGFARTPRLIAEKIPGNEGERIRKTLSEIPSDGGTNLEQAMALAQEISLRHKGDGAQNRILLLTDGAANLGNAKPEDLAQRVKSMRQNGLAFDIAGIGTDGLNDDLLLELARHGNGRYYVVNHVADAGDGFAKQLAGAFRPAAENVKVQVHFNPERVSRYRLIGFEKDRLKTEDFRNDAVDAAELAAAEAGQAIYQVELLPEGKGDIGEVSVRFRDTASSQMVERKWTIAHEASAPAWDRASPSMQLAGLAMFAAEKLKGGAVGEMVTFRDWQALRANVQQFYRQNQRVSQLMEMIRQIEP